MNLKTVLWAAGSVVAAILVGNLICAYVSKRIEDSVSKAKKETAQEDYDNVPQAPEEASTEQEPSNASGVEGEASAEPIEDRPRNLDDQHKEPKEI